MKLTPELKQELESQGYHGLREIPDRGICGIRQFIFTCAVISDMDETGYRGRWCYNTAAEALIALHTWDGKDDPSGNWIKYKGYPYERSNPNYK